MTSTETEDFVPTRFTRFDFIDNFMMLVSAPRGSGKTYFMNKLLLPSGGGLMEQFNYTIIASPSQEFNEDYDEIYDYIMEHDSTIEDPNNKLAGKVRFMTDVNSVDLSKLVMDQERLCRRVKNRRRRRGDEDEEPVTFVPKVLLILDDCLDSGVASFHNIIDIVACRGRHIKMSVIVNSQRMKSVSSVIRDNVNYFIFFQPYSVNELEKILEEFVSKDKHPHLRILLDEIFDKPHNFILVDNTDRLPRRLKVSDADNFVRGYVDILEVKRKVKKIKMEE